MTLPINWPGQGGRHIASTAYPIGTAFQPFTGVYVVCKPLPNGNWYPIYVGETGDFDQRLNTALQNHHAWAGCVHHGATHIALIVVPGGRANRLALETELRHSLRPPLNRQAA